MATALDRRTISNLILTASLIATFACTEKGGGSSATSGTPTDDDKIFYSIGVMAGTGIAKFEFTEDEFAWVARGVADAAMHREPLTNPEEQMAAIHQLYTARTARANEAEAKASAEFLASEAAAEGAIQSESGMIMRVIVEGTGEQPKPTDEVKVHYHGTLRDGTVFDSSGDRGEPAPFPLNRVIPCWTEALTQMKVGGKSRIVCPASLAYGANGMGSIPGDAALAFDVELLEIVK